MAEAILIAFGQRVKALRLKKKLSQAALAEKSGFDRNYIGMIERGERNPSLKNLKKYADVLGLSLSELMRF